VGLTRLANSLMEPAYVQSAYLPDGVWEAQPSSDFPPLPDLRRARTTPGRINHSTMTANEGMKLSSCSRTDDDQNAVSWQQGSSYLLGREAYTDQNYSASNDWWWGSQDAKMYTSGLSTPDVTPCWPVNAGTWFPPVARMTDQSILNPPPGLEEPFEPDELEDCAAISVALAGLPSPNDFSEMDIMRGKSYESSTTACTISSCQEAIRELTFEELGCRSEGREPPPQPQTLVHSQDASTGVRYVIWTVDAKKLRGSDKVAVSPPFEVEGALGQFKMMLCPKAISDRKGGSSFKKAKGKGFVQIKCEAELGSNMDNNLLLNVSVGNGRPDAYWQSPLKDPVQHNFEDCGVCCLPTRPEDEWNFLRAVDEPSGTFAVRLEAWPLSQDE
jgi:hypothetical protein